MIVKRILLFGAVTLAANAAQAATPEAWNEFQQAVAEACLAKAEPLFETAAAIVDPFGSESYGLALIQGKARGADAEIAAICVYDKVEKVAEIGGELPMEEAPSGPPRPSAAMMFQGPLTECGASCQRILGTLAPEDAAALETLPDRVVRTIAEILASTTLTSDPAAEAALGRVGKAEFQSGFGEVATGERTCTLYWFGFLDEASRRVGTHRCRIERDGERLLLTKLTGEGLSGYVEPLGVGTGILIARSYLEGHRLQSYDAGQPTNPENDNFGNHVGLAFADEGDLMVVSADMLGFTEPDETFFEVLVIE